MLPLRKIREGQRKTVGRKREGEVERNWKIGGRDKVGETGSGRDRDKGDGEIEGEREKMGERETMRVEK